MLHADGDPIKVSLDVSKQNLQHGTVIVLGEGRYQYAAYPQASSSTDYIFAYDALDVVFDDGRGGVTKQTFPVRIGELVKYLGTSSILKPIGLHIGMDWLWFGSSLSGSLIAWCEG